jgi:hypothetical protein
VQSYRQVRSNLDGVVFSGRERGQSAETIGGALIGLAHHHQAWLVAGGEREEIASSLALLAMTRGRGLSVLSQCGYRRAPEAFRFKGGV